MVTDNTDSLDFTLFQRRYWGGYHFPRRWNFLNKSRCPGWLEEPASKWRASQRS